MESSVSAAVRNPVAAGIGKKWSRSHDCRGTNPPGVHVSGRRRVVCQRVWLDATAPQDRKDQAKQRRVKYSKNKLFEPDYNIELGTFYFKGLVDLTGAPEYALAAYNAGEDRIALWKSERQYEEIPELVESIPFSQTRDYVQIVLRNATLYRMIYGPTAKPTTAALGGTSQSR
jgi:hypothetical protein